jgi:hypothetical protein
MLDECERINDQPPPFGDAFREIHRFILKALAGNAAAANALFQKYLNGELPEELLRISRSWVQEEQACAPNSLEGASIGVTDPHASEHLTPVRPTERRRLRRAKERRAGGPHLSDADWAGGPALDVGEWP